MPSQQNLAADIGEARGVEGHADPEQLDLILRNQSDQSDGADEWKDVRQIMRAACEHGGGGCRAGGGHYMMGVVMMFAELLEIEIKADLRAKPECQSDDIGPKLRELRKCEVPAGNQRQHAEVNYQQSRSRDGTECECSHDPSPVACGFEVQLGATDLLQENLPVSRFGERERPAGSPGRAIHSISALTVRRGGLRATLVDVLARGASVDKLCVGLINLKRLCARRNSTFRTALVGLAVSGARQRQCRQH